MNFFSCFSYKLQFRYLLRIFNNLWRLVLHIKFSEAMPFFCIVSRLSLILVFLIFGDFIIWLSSCMKWCLNIWQFGADGLDLNYIVFVFSIIIFCRNDLRYLSIVIFSSKILWTIKRIIFSWNIWRRVVILHLRLFFCLWFCKLILTMSYQTCLHCTFIWCMTFFFWSIYSRFSKILLFSSCQLETMLSILGWWLLIGNCA